MVDLSRCFPKEVAVPLLLREFLEWMSQRDDYLLLEDAEEEEEEAAADGRLYFYADQTQEVLQQQEDEQDIPLPAGAFESDEARRDRVHTTAQSLPPAPPALLARPVPGGNNYSNNNYNNTGTEHPHDPGVAQDIQIERDGKQSIRLWWGAALQEEDLLARLFICFACDDTGGLYCFWNHLRDDLVSWDVMESPVVLLDSECSNNCILAPNFVDFLRVLVFGGDSSSHFLLRPEVDFDWSRMTSSNGNSNRSRDRDSAGASEEEALDGDAFAEEPAFIDGSLFRWLEGHGFSADYKVDIPRIRLELLGLPNFDLFIAEVEKNGGYPSLLQNLPLTGIQR